MIFVDGRDTWPLIDRLGESRHEFQIEVLVFVSFSLREYRFAQEVDSEGHLLLALGGDGIQRFGHVTSSDKATGQSLGIELRRPGHQIRKWPGFGKYV